MSTPPRMDNKPVDHTAQTPVEKTPTKPEPVKASGLGRVFSFVKGAAHQLMQVFDRGSYGTQGLAKPKSAETASFENKSISHLDDDTQIIAAGPFEGLTVGEMKKITKEFIKLGVFNPNMKSEEKARILAELSSRDEDDTMSLSGRSDSVLSLTDLDETSSEVATEISSLTAENLSLKAELDQLKNLVKQMQEQPLKDADKGLMALNLSLIRQQRELKSKAESAGIVVDFTAPQYECKVDELINAAIESMLEPFMKDGSPLPIDELTDTEKNIKTADLKAAQKALQDFENALPAAKDALLAAKLAEPERMRMLQTLTPQEKFRAQLENPVAEAELGIKDLEKKIADAKEKVAIQQGLVEVATDKILFNKKGNELIKLAISAGLLYFDSKANEYRAGSNLSKADEIAAAKLVDGIKKFMKLENRLIREPGLNMDNYVDFTTKKGEALLESLVHAKPSPVDIAMQKQYGVTNLMQGVNDGLTRLRQYLVTFVPMIPKDMMLPEAKKTLIEKYATNTLPQHGQAKTTLTEKVRVFNENAKEIANIYTRIKQAGTIGDRLFAAALKQIMPQVDALKAKGEMPQHAIDECKKEISRLYLDAVLAEFGGEEEIKLALDRCKALDIDISSFESQLAHRGLSVKEAAPPPPPPPPGPPPPPAPMRKK